MYSMMTSRRKLNLAFLTLVMALIVIAAMIEAASYYVIVVNGTNFYLPRPDSDKIGKFRTSKTFSYELGWAPNHPNKFGYRGNEKDIADSAIAVFGDSYTRGFLDIDKS
jgi:hypothetical protein